MKLCELMAPDSVDVLDHDSIENATSGSEINSCEITRSKNLVKARGKNFKRAKRIRALTKDNAKAANPDESETPSGWRADPHQGGHFSNFLNR